MSTKRNIDVLVVDDNELVMNTLRKVLDHESLSYVCATNGIEALDLLKDNEVRFIISDIDMPEMDGVELAKRVRISDPDIRIVAFTGSSGDVLLKEAGNYFDTIYSKSESALTLAKQIKKILVDQLETVS